MTGFVQQTRWGAVRSITMLRRRTALPLKYTGAARAFTCAAPAARGFDPEKPVRACSAKARWCYQIERLIVPLCLTHARAAARAGEALFVVETAGVCRECGCTDGDCSGCLERTGKRCSWTDPARVLCSACVAPVPAGAGADTTTEARP